MSGGLNNLFINDPVTFLQNNLIVHNAIEPFTSETEDPEEREFTFVERMINGRQAKAIKRNQDGSYSEMRVVELQLYGSTMETRAGPKSKHSHPLVSHYLPYMRGRAIGVHMGNDRPFMFNHSLTGCTLALTKEGATASVMHIADNLSAAQKDLHRQQFFGNRPVRQFVEKEYSAAAMTHVVGIYTKQHGWRFYAQGYDTADDYSFANSGAVIREGSDYFCYFGDKVVLV